MISNLMKRAFTASNEEITSAGSIFGAGMEILATLVGKVNPAIQFVVYQGKKVGENFKALTNDAVEIAMGCLMGAGALRGVVIKTKNAMHPDKMYGFHKTFGLQHT